jgi:hypothetical protein
MKSSDVKVIHVKGHPRPSKVKDIQGQGHPWSGPSKVKAKVIQGKGHPRSRSSKAKVF